MMRALILLVMALAMPAQADDEHRLLPPIPAAVPWMTGAQLLQKLGKPAEAASAEEYIKGVHDATDRSEWCYIGPNGKPLAKPRPADLQAQVRAVLSGLPADQLRQNAAKLLVRAWQDKWPCPPNGCCDG
jgi:hypothetical protein